MAVYAVHMKKQQILFTRICDAFIELYIETGSSEEWYLLINFPLAMVRVNVEAAATYPRRSVIVINVAMKAHNRMAE